MPTDLPDTIVEVLAMCALAVVVVYASVVAGALIANAISRSRDRRRVRQ